MVVDDTFGTIAALGQDAVGALHVHWHHRHAAAHRQIAGPAQEGLAPAVGAAAAFGKDEQAPAVFDREAARRAERRPTLDRSMGMAPITSAEAADLSAPEKK